MFEKTIRKLYSQLRCFTSGFHAGEDPAPTSKDVHVRCPLNPPLEFIHARPDKYRVRMGIHETRQNYFAGRIELRCGSVGQLIRRPYPFDSFTVDRQCSIFDDAEFKQFRSPSSTRRPSNRNKLGSMNEVKHVSLSSPWKFDAAPVRKFACLGIARVSVAGDADA